MHQDRLTVINSTEWHSPAADKLAFHYQRTSTSSQNGDSNSLKSSRQTNGVIHHHCGWKELICFPCLFPSLSGREESALADLVRWQMNCHNPAPSLYRSKEDSLPTPSSSVKEIHYNERKSLNTRRRYAFSHDIYGSGQMTEILPPTHLLFRLGRIWHDPWWIDVFDHR